MIRLGQKSEKIYRALSEDIESGNYRINSRLPTESELCKEFKCCHNTVRNALERLIREEKIESRRGSGSYVKQDTAKASSNILALMYLGTSDTLTKIQDLSLKRNSVLAFYSQNRTHWNIKTERKFLQQVKEQKHHGLLAFCSPISPYNEDVLQQIQSSGTMVVHYEYYKEFLPNENFVLPDYRQAGYLGVTTLLLSGYKKLYYCGLDEQTPYHILQEKGFLNAINEHSIGPSTRKTFSEYRSDGNFFRMPKIGIDKDDKERLDDFIGHLKPNSAIYCNVIGRGNIMLEEMTKRGIRVPEDVGILSTATLGADIEPSQFDYIKFDRDKIFKRAMNAIFDPECNAIHELVPPILCKVPKRHSK